MVKSRHTRRFCTNQEMSYMVREFVARYSTATTEDLRSFSPSVLSLGEDVVIAIRKAINIILKERGEL